MDKRDSFYSQDLFTSAVLSLSDKISCKVFVPRMFLLILEFETKLKNIHLCGERSDQQHMTCRQFLTALEYSGMFDVNTPFSKNSKTSFDKIPEGSAR